MVKFLNNKKVAVVILILAIVGAIRIGAVKYDAKVQAIEAENSTVTAVAEEEETNWFIKVLDFSVYGAVKH